MNDIVVLTCTLGMSTPTTSNIQNYIRLSNHDKFYEYGVLSLEVSPE